VSISRKEEVQGLDSHLGGSITLNSSDPFAHPLIDVNLLAQDLDFVILREALRSAQRLFSAPSFQSSIKAVILPPTNATSDDELDIYIQSDVVPWIHGVGSLSMSPHGTNWGAVDPDFRVKGTQGLRVVDSSIIASTSNVSNIALLTQYSSAIYFKWTYAGGSVCTCRKCEFNNCRIVAIKSPRTRNWRFFFFFFRNLKSSYPSR
jgi:choline dehydrogenase-like flavoprotein